MCEGSLRALVAHILLLFDGKFETQVAWLSPTHLVEGIGGVFVFAKK